MAVSFVHKTLEHQVNRAMCFGSGTPTDHAVINPLAQDLTLCAAVPMESVALPPVRSCSYGLRAKSSGPNV
jgi:hypothetical protein